ncbi:hypothetical protein GCM10023116_08930 [Kistimonas scapharcae]|uniref:Uncharacterized protein n=1 Tax=Kistimonas scapharcae TaxID=1036133 RepID=A0ABP8UY05_9GAMM
MVTISVPCPDNESHSVLVDIPRELANFPRSRDGGRIDIEIPIHDAEQLSRIFDKENRENLEDTLAENAKEQCHDTFTYTQYYDACDYCGSDGDSRLG